MLPHVNLKTKLLCIAVLIFENHFYQNKYILEDKNSEVFINSFSIVYLKYIIEH